MKIALITSWNEKCGIAEYATNLITYCKDIDFRIVPRSEAMPIALSIIDPCDIVQLNFEPGILSHWNEKVIRSLNKPSVLTLHTSHEGNNRSDFTNSFSRVVVHEKTQDGFTFIPMGIPKFQNIENSPLKFDVGTFGFPFPWKGFSEVVQACKILDMHCLVIAPESRHTDTFIMKEHLKSLHDKVTYISEYLDQNQVIAMLKECKVLSFPYHGGNYGISAACRLGLATGNPIVLSRSRQFRDLFDYEDEIQFIAQPPSITDLAFSFKALSSNYPTKRPKRILEDYSWNRVGEMYKKLYEELI